MKQLMALTLIVLLAISCKQIKPTHHLDLRLGKSHFKGFNTKLLREDSIKLAKLKASHIWSRHGSSFLETMVFAKSSVQMVEVNKLMTDFNAEDFRYCEATKTDTGLVIRLKQYSPIDDVVLFAGTIVEYSINGEVLKTKVIDWSDVGGLGPQSDIVWDNLIIWGNTLEKGDTISGRMHLIANKNTDKRRIFKGNFNAIIR
ncbi:MAG: hypothetical protein IT258_05090 [Saprospiraceae bacterium]|nr:hypothetical protein [Saprospiraceae bacterium]